MTKQPTTGNELRRLIAQIDFNSERYYNLYFESEAQLPPDDPATETWTNLSLLTTDLTKVRGELARVRMAMEQLRMPAIEAVGLDKVTEQLGKLESRLQPLGKLTKAAEGEDPVRRLLKQIIQVVDAFDRVFELVDKQPEQISEGMSSGLQSVHRMLLDSLRRAGLETVPIKPGDAFDPNVAMAMGTEPNPELSDGVVSQVLVSGYLYHEQVLRTAQVVVVKN